MSTARPLRSFGTRIKRTPGPEDGGKPVAGIISVDADAGPDHYKAPSAGGVAGADSGGGGGGGGGGASGASGAALATTRLGITLRGLRRLRAVLRERFGLGFDNMSTAEVNEKWVEVVTAQRRCRLLEMGEWVDEDDVAPPTYFVSHTWKNRHSRLLEQVLGYLASAAEGVAVWIDILAVNQHEDTRAHRADIAAFAEVVRACSGGTLVVLDRERCSPATRAWCIYEWAHTLALHGPDGLHLHLDPHDRATVSATIDVEKAECFKPADKAFILGDVRRIHGSAQRFNAKLKLQLLLEPLSYEADMRRLTARAEALGTRWRFESLDRWLGSKSRALVALRAAAGAGGGSGGGRITAHHFLKYNDQRRLEPVAIVKSLAFQLAERFSAVAAKLLALDVAKVASLQDVGEAVDLLLLAPLKALPPADRRQKDVVLLLDALDEADPLDQQLAALAAEAEGAGGGGGPTAADPGAGGDAGGGGGPGPGPCPLVCGNRALQLVSAHLVRLPPCVRFVFTTRPDAAGGQVLPCLRRLFPDLQQLPPGELRVTDTAALLAAAAPPQVGGTAVPGRVLVGAAAEAAVEAAKKRREAAEAAAAAARGSGGAGQAPPKGVMIYYSVAPLVRGSSPAAIAAMAAHTCPQLGEVYELYRLIFKSRMEHLQRSDPVLGDLVGDLVAAVMAAQEPLSSSFLQQLGLGTAVPALPGAPVCFFEADHHVFTVHKSLGDWLLDASKSGPFAADVRRGHELIGLQLAKGWGVTTGGPGGGDGVGGAAGSAYKSPYALRYTVTHLAAAAGGAAGAAAGPAAAALDALLGSFAFLRDVVVSGAGPAAIGALGGMRRPTTRSRDVLRFLRAELYALLRAAADVEEGSSGAAAGAEAQRQAQATAFARAALYAAGHSTVCAAAVAHLGLAWATSRVLPRAAGEWSARLAVLQGHKGPVTALAFSPDGQQLLSGGSDGQLRAWDPATGDCRVALEQPRAAGEEHEPVSRLAFSADGRRMATGGGGGSAWLWDAATGQCVATLRPPPPPPPAAGGARAVAAAIARAGAVTALALTSDSRFLAVATAADCLVRVWDVAAAAAAAAAAAPAAAAEAAAAPPLAPRPLVVVTGLFSSAVTGLAFLEPPLPRGGNTTTSSSKEREMHLAAASGRPGDCVRVVLNIQQLVAAATTAAPPPTLAAVAVADGLAVVDAAAPPPRAPAGEEPQQARLLREHRPVSQAGSQGLRGAGALAPATDGVSALVVCGREVRRLWFEGSGYTDIGTVGVFSSTSDVLAVAQYGSRAAVISASGGRLLGGGGGGRAAAADVTLPGLPAEAVARRGGGGGVTAVSIEGQFATTGGGDGSIIVWDTAPRGDRASGAAGAAAAAADGPAAAHDTPAAAAAAAAVAAPACAAFHPDGRQLAVGGAEDVRLYDTATGELAAPPLPGRAECLEWSPGPGGGQQLAVCGGTTSCVWESLFSQGSAALEAEAAVAAVGVGAGGKLLAAGCADGKVLVWATLTRRLLSTLTMSTAHLPGGGGGGGFEGRGAAAAAASRGPGLGSGQAAVAAAAGCWRAAPRTAPCGCGAGQPQLCGAWWARGKRAARRGCGWRRRGGGGGGGCAGWARLRRWAVRRWQLLAAAVGSGRGVLVWALARGGGGGGAVSCSLALTLKGHLNPVTSLAFDAAGLTLASGSADKTVRLWGHGGAGGGGGGGASERGGGGGGAGASERGGGAGGGEGGDG
ncbi:hypothetical protein HXX76_016255, partial [Chlamydomonas incerta]